MPRAGRPERAPVPGDVLGAMHELGIEVERIEGGEIWARCPMHVARLGKADRHASFSVSEERGVFLCFSCGYKGSFATLVADLLGLEPVAAAVWTASYGALTRAQRLLHQRNTAPAPAAAEPSLGRFRFPPLAALEARGIDADAAARFGILWDEGSGGFVLPIREARGRLLGYQYKSGHYVRNRPRGVAKSCVLFGLHAFTGHTAVLVESPLDCARLWSAGIPGAVAAYGAAVSDAQIELLVRAADTVIIALDNDETGRLASDQVAARLRGRVRALYFHYPRRAAKDPGELTDAEIGRGIDQASSKLKRALVK